ncbi:MAG: sulfotransferase [Novosphingobium sp.]|nr:MAG: sulfotransferase [Novosphingobium sp.]
MTSELDQAKQAFAFEPLLDQAFAEAGTGASSFRDESFFEGLHRVLAIPHNIAISLSGVQIMHANSLRFLVNRLRWEADVERHPEILDEDVDDPIVVLGLPRSGTTKLQRFLSADPALQATPAWAMWNPAPFPGEMRGDPSPRREWAARMMNAVTNTGETYQKMHEFAADEAEESSFIPIANFDNIGQFITAPDYSYLDWLRSRSRVPSQAYLKQQLKYLQWQNGGKNDRPWLLKNPCNTGEFLEVLEVFPRATFVISRRDIYKTMGSSMRMGTEILQNTFDPLDPKFVGQYTVDIWAYEAKRCLEQRQAKGSEVRLIEADYRTCVTDGISVAREVYAAHGLPWTARGEAAMRQWDIDNPRHKLGSYGYELEDYGWSEEKIAEAFGPIAEDWRGK